MNVNAASQQSINSSPSTRKGDAVMQVSLYETVLKFPAYNQSGWLAERIQVLYRKSQQKYSCSSYSLVFVVEDVNLKGARCHQSGVVIWR